MLPAAREGHDVIDVHLMPKFGEVKDGAVGDERLNSERFVIDGANGFIISRAGPQSGFAHTLEFRLLGLDLG